MKNPTTAVIPDETMDRAVLNVLVNTLATSAAMALIAVTIRPGSCVKNDTTVPIPNPITYARLENRVEKNDEINPGRAVRALTTLPGRAVKNPITDEATEEMNPVTELMIPEKNETIDDQAEEMTPGILVKKLPTTDTAPVIAGMAVPVIQSTAEPVASSTACHAMMMASRNLLSP